MNRILLGIVASTICLLASHIASAARRSNPQPTKSWKPICPACVISFSRMRSRFTKRVHQAVPGTGVEDFKGAGERGHPISGRCAGLLGPRTLSPGGTTEVWCRSPGEYVLICWDHIAQFCSRLDGGGRQACRPTHRQGRRCFCCCAILSSLQGHLKRGTRHQSAVLGALRYTKPTSFDSPGPPPPMSSVGTRKIWATPRLQIRRRCRQP
jgi:hypothetical protein